MEKALFINGNRNGYSPDQCRSTFSIREMIEALEEMADTLGEDTKIFLRNDNGYTYGSINTEDLTRGAYDDYHTRVLEPYETYADVEDEFDSEDSEDQ